MILKRKFSNLVESKNENADTIARSVFRDQLYMKLSTTDLDWSHRTGKQHPKNKRKPILMKFIRFNDCKKIFINKKRLKRRENLHN